MYYLIDRIRFLYPLKMAEGHVVINWNEFDSSAPSTIQQLWLDKHFTDVTLVSEDEIGINVHKVILSSGSKFFKNILTNYTNPNPLIYLKGVNGKELKLLIKFIYLGKCEVQHEELEHFLVAGKDLKINGLTDEITGTDFELKREPCSPKKFVMQDCEKSDIERKAKESKNQIETFETKTKDTREESTKPREAEFLQKLNTDEIPNTSIALNQTNDSMHIKEIFHPEPKESLHTKQSKPKAPSLFSNIANEKSSPSVEFEVRDKTMQPKQSNSDVTGFPCDVCDKSYRDKSNLNLHKSKKHDGRRVDCNMCDFQATRQSTLEMHKRFIHDGIGHECTMCDKKFQQANGLKSHMNKHVDNDK